MKILLATGIYPPETGGPAIYTHQLAEALLSLGHTVHVISYGDARASTPGVSLISRNGGPLIRYLRYFLRALGLAKSVDVVYVQGGVSEGFPATLAALCVGRPTVIRIPGDYAWEMAQQRGEKLLLDEFLIKKSTGIIGWYNRIERWTTRHAKRVIVPSKYLAKVVYAWGIAPEKIEVIHSTITPLANVAPRQELRRREGWQENDVILYTNVRAVPWKGVDFLLGVLKDLPATHHLVCIGEGPELPAWKKLAQDYGLGSRVRFLGRVDRHVVAEWCQMSDVFVLASGYEGFAHVIVEAVSVGLPCVVSDKAGNPEARELFPEHITVLPYQDHHAWVQSLSKEYSRRPSITPEPFDEVVKKVLKVFEEVCVS